MASKSHLVFTENNIFENGKLQVITGSDSDDVSHLVLGSENVHVVVMALPNKRNLSIAKTHGTGFVSMQRRYPNGKMGVLPYELMFRFADKSLVPGQPDDEAVALAHTIIGKQRLIDSGLDTVKVYGMVRKVEVADEAVYELISVFPIMPMDMEEFSRLAKILSQADISA